MKKLATILCLSALATAVYAQGTVTLANGSYALARTNALGIAGGTAGPTAPALGGFQFGLFTAASTVTSLTAADLLGSAWTFTGLVASNTAATTGGRFTAGTGTPTLTGWPSGQTNSYVVVGWSTDLGTSWSAIQAQLAGATLANGVYNGNNWLRSGGFFGLSSVAYGAAGGGAAGLPALSLFGLAATGQGVPISTPFDLYVTNVPEPGTFALAGLGAAALLIFRRRK